MVTTALEDHAIPPDEADTVGQIVARRSPDGHVETVDGDFLAGLRAEQVQKLNLGQRQAKLQLVLRGEKSSVHVNRDQEYHLFGEDGQIDTLMDLHKRSCGANGILQR